MGHGTFNGPCPGRHPWRGTENMETRKKQNILYKINGIIIVLYMLYFVIIVIYYIYIIHPRI